MTLAKHFLVFVGTRPEAIKLFPVINQLKKEKRARVTVCATAQHRELLDQVLKLADIVPDIDLDVMRPNQSLDQLSAGLLLRIGEVLDRIRPDRADRTGRHDYGDDRNVSVLLPPYAGVACRGRVAKRRYLRSLAGGGQ